MSVSRTRPSTRCSRPPASRADEARKAAYAALQTQLATGRYILPIAFADEVVVARDTLEDRSSKPVADGSDRYGMC